MNPQLCVQLTIHGNVQGVGFRRWAVTKAHTMGLTGWVRNTEENTVEILLCGDETIVEEMVAQCALGPSTAEVTEVERKMPDVPPPADFVQR